MFRVIELQLAPPRTERLLPRGTSNVHIPPQNAELGLQHTSIGKMTDKRAAWPFLSHEFFAETPPNADNPNNFSLTNIVERDGTLLRLVRQGSPYADRNVMIVGTISPPPIEGQTHTGLPKVRTHFPQQFSLRGETSYQAAKLATLAVAYEYAGKDDVPLVAEHRTIQVSSDTCTLPRTVALPHATTILVDTNYIEPTTESESLSVERMTVDADTVTGLATIIYTGLHRSLTEHDIDPESVTVHPRFGDVNGYGIAFPGIRPENLTEPDTIALVTAVLHAEHEIYSTVGVKYLNNALPNQVQGTKDGAPHVYRRKPQPATAQSLDLQKGVLVATTMPIGHTRLGVLERYGVALDRKPNHPTRHGREDIIAFQQAAGSAVTEIWRAMQ